MSDFLLELRSEEIPARMQAGARTDLEKLFRKEMAAAGLAVGELTVWSTPRRLALIARDLADATQAVSEEVKGPRVGAPPQAMEGFLRKTGLSQDQLIERDSVFFAISEKPGRATRDVLAEAIPAIIRAFPWPKSQRWGAASLSSESLRWVRPLSGIVAILGEELVPCEVGGITSGYATRGHRFHAPGEITIGGAHDYADKLSACHVIVDHEERQNLIRTRAHEVAAEAGLVLVEDEGLVIENAGLTEWPVPLLGRFDEAFLEVPPEVIQLTARTNQKYFVCEVAGKLANAFICTANIVAADGGAAIVAGNRKVLAARLSDARFFWEQDRKTELAFHADKLNRIKFHEKLGTVSDKSYRVSKMARTLIESGVVGTELVRTGQKSREDLAGLVELASLCAKADLVTDMVGEFPELQGLMGSYYARAEGMPSVVSDAIREHYLPIGQFDVAPTAPVSVAVALADKLDTLVCFFAIDERPTGSKDPFALRRAAISALQIIITNELRIPLRDILVQGVNRLASQILIADLYGRSLEYLEISSRFYSSTDEAAKVLKDQILSSDNNKHLEETAKIIFECHKGVAHLMDFFADRLKVQQREAGVRHDLIDAVFALGGEDDLVRLLARVHALQAFIATQDGTNLLAGYKRAANILKKEAFEPGAANPAPEPAEAALIAALDEAEPRATAAIEAEDFTAAMAALASLRAPIDAFFEHVTVNDADPEKRAARLTLLSHFRVAVHKVADFSRIEG